MICFVLDSKVSTQKFCANELPACAVFVNPTLYRRSSGYLTAKKRPEIFSKIIVDDLKEPDWKLMKMKNSCPVKTFDSKVGDFNLVSFKFKLVRQRMLTIFERKRFL